MVAMIDHERSRRSTARAMPAVVMLVAVLLASACGAPSRPPTQSSSPGAGSGILGIVLFVGGPYVPNLSASPLPDGFGTQARGRPYRFVTVRITALDGRDAGRVVAIRKPDAQSLFTVSLAPGSYALDALVPKDGPFPLLTRVTVPPEHYVRAVVRVEGP